MWTGPFGDERAYRIDEPRRYRRGGLGVVFEAVVCSDRHGPDLVEARVALKQLTGIDDYRWQKLEERSQRLALVEHRHLSRHLGVFAGPRPWRDGREPDDEDDPQRYIVHLWVDGQPLAEVVDTGVGAVLHWLRQIADGLDHLHAHPAGPFAHRDLHPRNVIVTAQGDAVVIDFDTVFAGDTWTTTKTPLASRFAPPSTPSISPQAADRSALAKIALHALAGDGDGALDDKEVRESAAGRLRGHGANPEPAVALLEQSAAGGGPETCAELVAQLEAATGGRPTFPQRAHTARWMVLAALLALIAVGGSWLVSRPDPAPHMWIGALAAVGEGVSGFASVDASIGPLRYRRCFQADLVVASSGQSCAKSDWPRYRSFVSLRPPGGDFRGAADGKYDGLFSAWAASVPRDIGLYATVWYEPERNEVDMTGPQFVAMFRGFYSVVKAANPIPLRNDPQFQGWLRFADAKAPTLPRVIAEYGQYKLPADAQPNPAKQADRARIIALDEKYLRSKHFVLWIYHDADVWALSDAESQAAWRRVAAHGRSR